MACLLAGGGQPLVLPAQRALDTAGVEVRKQIGQRIGRVEAGGKLGRLASGRGRFGERVRAAHLVERLQLFLDIDEFPQAFGAGCHVTCRW